MMRYTLGIDIGGTHLRIGFSDRAGGVHHVEKHSSQCLLSANPVQTLADIALDYIARYGEENEVAAVCVGFPATVAKSGDTVLNAPSLKGFDGVNVKRPLEAALRCPVYVEKDVNLLLLCDLQEQSIDAKDVVGVYVGTGLGNAMMIGSKLLRGHHGVAGELGHIPFGDDESLCGCGNVGCSEELVAGKYLARLCQSCYPQTHVSELFCKHGEDRVLVQYLERLARTVAAEINILDPECLILGGGVLAMQGFPQEELCRRILAHVRKPLPHDRLKILFSKNADRCGVIGAGIYAWKRLDGEDL